jgi:hypothetical protein
METRHRPGLAGQLRSPELYIRDTSNSITDELTVTGCHINAGRAAFKVNGNTIATAGKLVEVAETAKVNVGINQINGEMVSGSEKK